jgi:magnesium chelatase subunit I
MKYDNNKITTLAQLRESNYLSRSTKDEMRENLIIQLRSGKQIFKGIIGYEETVIPDIQSAILSRHNIILLGLRGQAKTKIARLMVTLLDDYIPIIAGSELNDNPFQPISRYGKDKISEMGGDTPIEWIYKDERYSEKLATPDVTIADLIGDVDPIKAASLKLPYSDERVIHFGLIPRSHRGIFVINELPDLQARIQVALFNILEEKDVQIRGFKIRLPLDVQFVFTANPEDYTNRGSIVTPLKDRIDSQILTHYARTIDESRIITELESKLTKEQMDSVSTPRLVKDLVEHIAFEARKSEYVDSKSGVSARLTISAIENLVSTAERRMIINVEEKTTIRISDFIGVIPSITGKVELVYEGEQEGTATVAQILIGKAIKKQFEEYFPSPDKIKKTSEKNPYAEIIHWFSHNNLDLLNNSSDKEYYKILCGVTNLGAFIKKTHPDLPENEYYLMMEFLLHGLAEHSLISKQNVEFGLQFKDMISTMFTMDEGDENFEDEDYVS